MPRDSFIFYRSFYEAIKEIPENDQLKTFMAITEYALNEKEIELEGIPKAIFTLMKPNINSSIARYEASVENGKKGGRPKKETQQKPKHNLEETQRKPRQNLNYNVNENVNVNVNVNENNNNNASDSCVDGLQKVIEFYNNNIGLITPYGAEVLESYVKDMEYDVIIFAIQKAVEANVRNIAYIKGTLNNWYKAGVKTLIQAKEESQKFNKTKAKSAEEEFLNEYR